MTGSAIMAFTFRKLKQITTKESLGIGKTCCITRFSCDSTAFLLPRAKIIGISHISIQEFYNFSKTLMLNKLITHLQNLERFSFLVI